jgi:hypothetical protein
MGWHIVVESENGDREIAGLRSDDLDEVTAAALSLADELGRLTMKMQAPSIVHILSDMGKAELSIVAFQGGLDPA